MKNTFGQNVTITLFGESHGPYIGAVLDGLTPGMSVDESFIAHQLDLRRPSGKISTARVEADEYQIVSGMYNGKTTGTPLCIIIPNKVHKSDDYDKTVRIARPGHADYAAYCKYHGFEDYHGGGHFSGRITAAIVAAAAVIIPALNKKGITLATHISSCGGIKDREFENIDNDIEFLNNTDFAVLDGDSSEKIHELMEKIAAEGDSIGGTLETVIKGLPKGVGEPWFDSMESLISHAVFSIPAVKGIQFGKGFDYADRKGSEFNDPFRIKDGEIITVTNNNGGINGGITNGMPVLFKTMVKPTPSIYKEQESVDFVNNTEENLSIKGRHDPAIIHRARVVVDSMTALVVYDSLIGRFGTDFFEGD